MIVPILSLPQIVQVSLLKRSSLSAITTLDMNAVLVDFE